MLISMMRISRRSCTGGVELALRLGFSADDEELASEDVPEGGNLEEQFQGPQGGAGTLGHGVGEKLWNDFLHLVAAHDHDFGER